MNINIVEQKVTVNSTFDLGATLAMPEQNKQQMPALVLISGTGTADRDGNMPKFVSNIYKKLSDFFVGQGFVVIRYDKRGVGESKGEHSKTGFNDLVDDVIANVKYLEELQAVDSEKIFLCGHSEGAMIATIASTRHKVAGIILIGGAGTSLRSALEFQNWLVLQEVKTMTGFQGWLLRKVINEKNYLKNVNAMFEKCCNTDKEVINLMLKKFPAKWIREHNEITDESMLQIIANATFPIFAVTGERDVQANPEDVKRIEKLGLAHVTCRLIADMDHILRKSQGEKTVLKVKQQYVKEFSQPLHEDLLRELQEWIKRVIN